MEALSSRKVRKFYERHPYPPPVENLARYREVWTNPARRVIESYLYWPQEHYREDRSILVAGCGTSQAARHAMKWPKAKVVGVDFSATSVKKTELLKKKYDLHNLSVFQMDLERVVELGQEFDQIVSTGVLHHLLDPDAGLKALRSVLASNGAMQIMLYAPYGRAGIYMIQDYCRRLGIGTTNHDIQHLSKVLACLPKEHPLGLLLANAPDFRNADALADALLNPQDRPYSVPEVFGFLERADLRFGRWLRQAPYEPECGIMAASPDHASLKRLPLIEAYSAVELFRGTMVEHSFIAHRADVSVNPQTIRFDGDDWLAYVPLRMPDTICVRERLPHGSVGVLINTAHTFTDIFLPIDAEQDASLDLIDGVRSVGEIMSKSKKPQKMRTFLKTLWRYDQIVFNRAVNR